MNDRGKWIMGFVITLTLALVSGGAAIIFRMDAAFLKNQTAQLKNELALRQGELQDSENRQEALNRHVTELKDKLQAAQEALDNMDQEMRAQKERLDLDFQEQFNKERRKVKELKAINDMQREGFFETDPKLDWQDRLEKMKSENPERYQQIMEARNRRQQQRQEQQERRKALLAQLENSRLPEAKIADVRRYREITEQMEQFRQQSRNMTPEERMEFFRTNKGIFREMNNLNEVIRNELFDQAVKSGKTDQAKEVLDLFPNYGGKGTAFPMKRQLKKDSRF